MARWIDFQSHLNNSNIENRLAAAEEEKNRAAKRVDDNAIVPFDQNLSFCETASADWKLVARHV